MFKIWMTDGWCDSHCKCFPATNSSKPKSANKKKMTKERMNKQKIEVCIAKSSAWTPSLTCSCCYFSFGLFDMLTLILKKVWRGRFRAASRLTNYKEYEYLPLDGDTLIFFSRVNGIITLLKAVNVKYVIVEPSREKKMTRCLSVKWHAKYIETHALSIWRYHWING